MSPQLAPTDSPNSGEKYPRDTTYQQDEYTEKATFGQKAKRHCARFWWIHLIIFCLVFLLVALLV